MTEQAQPIPAMPLPKQLTPDEAEAKRLADMPTAQLLVDLSDSITKGTAFFGHGELLNRMVAGRLTEAKLKAAEAKGYQVSWDAMLKDYKAGTYFGQQGLDFLSFLMVTEKEVDEDLAKWNKMDAAATALGLRSDPTFCDAESFAYSRVKLAHPYRRFYLTKTNGLRFDLHMGGRINLKTLRTSFNAAAKRHGWKS